MSAVILYNVDPINSPDFLLITTPLGHSYCFRAEWTVRIRLIRRFYSHPSLLPTVVHSQLREKTLINTRLKNLRIRSTRQTSLPEILIYVTKWPVKKIKPIDVVRRTQNHSAMIDIMNVTAERKSSVIFIFYNNTNRSPQVHKMVAENVY